MASKKSSPRRKDVGSTGEAPEHELAQDEAIELSADEAQIDDVVAHAPQDDAAQAASPAEEIVVDLQVVSEETLSAEPVDAVPEPIVEPVLAEARPQENAEEPVAVRPEEPPATEIIEPIVASAEEPVAERAAAFPEHPLIDEPASVSVDAAGLPEPVAAEAAWRAETPFESSLQSSAIVALDFAAPAKAASEWHRTAVDVWSENATALLDLTAALGKAKSVSDVLDLQARFARRQLAGLARLSNDYVALAQRAARDAGVASFKISKSA
ncbi:MAG TPA: phasin family protein [Methylocystis sp.]|nr:phasin family protein [Methylocystis sp.]